MLMKRIVQANIKRQKHQTSVKNVIFVSAKIDLSNIIPTVNWKGNYITLIRLYEILAVKVAFSSIYFVFTVFLLIFYLF